MLKSKAVDSDIVIRIERRRKELWVDNNGGEWSHGLTLVKINTLNLAPQAGFTQGRPLARTAVRHCPITSF